jgi:hypothetical protein
MLSLPMRSANRAGERAARRCRREPHAPVNGRRWSSNATSSQSHPAAAASEPWFRSQRLVEITGLEKPVAVCVASGAHARMADGQNVAVSVTTCSGVHSVELLVRRKNASAATGSRVRDNQQSSTSSSWSGRGRSYAVPRGEGPARRSNNGTVPREARDRQLTDSPNGCPRSSIGPAEQDDRCMHAQFSGLPRQKSAGVCDSAGAAGCPPRRHRRRGPGHVR